MKTQQVKFIKVLGSKLDGRGGQLFYLSLKSKRIPPRYDFYSFYIRADDGLKDCWAEFGLNSKENATLMKQLFSTTPLELFDVSFEYLKKRIKEGIAYKNLHKKPLPAEFKNCSDILNCEAKEDLHWNIPPFFTKTLRTYRLEQQTDKTLDKITGIVLEIFPKMLSLGWGFNDEEMDKEIPTLSKIKYNPIKIYYEKLLPKTLRDLIGEEPNHQFYKIMNTLMKKIINKPKITEWEIRTREQAYFSYNIDEKKIAENLHKISLTLKTVEEKTDMQKHPFLQMLMLISIMTTLKRNKMLVE